MNFYFWRESIIRDMDTALHRARAGAAWLDERHGPNWDRLVDVDRLDIASPFLCVLGQLSANGIDNFPTINRAVDCGFSCGLFSDLLSLFTRFPSLQDSYARLNEAWRIVLAERRDAGTISRPAETAGRRTRSTKLPATVVG